MFENVKRDYEIHNQKLRNRCFWALVVYRFGVWSLNRRSRFLQWFTSKIYGVAYVFSQIITGIHMDRHVKIGKDFHVIHAGSLYINTNVVIGDRCGVMHMVTIGSNMSKDAPIVGDDVFIGAGASILGRVKVGDHARIGANSLVINDVPPYGVVIGVPAKQFASTSLFRRIREVENEARQRERDPQGKSRQSPTVVRALKIR